MERFSALIAPAELRANLHAPELRVVDCRASLQDPAAGRRAYAEQHVPGAVFADLLEDLSGPIAPGVTGRHPLPDAMAFAQRLAGWGIGNQSQVVAYDDAGGAFAARLWWLLRFLGHDAVAVLDGGWSAWLGAAGPVSADVPAWPPQHFHAAPVAPLLVDAAELLEHPANVSALFDARAPERFRGDVEPIDAVAGHIPGARNLPFAENLRDGRFRSPAELRAHLLGALGGAAPERAAVYCGSGVTACHELLAFVHAGLAMPRLYAGSWSEWITDPQRPVAKG
jgi:thiosulfate/3-mercaptopyruvate sulfurtransferase